MDLYKLIKKQEKKSASEILIKVIVVVGALAAITLLLAALYKKWQKCTSISVNDDFDDEWFCDCGCDDNSCVSSREHTDDCCTDENCCCPGESGAEVEYEAKKDKGI